MRLAPWLFLPLLFVTGCHWKGDGSDEFIRDPFFRASPTAHGGAKDPRDFGVPEQEVPRKDGRADLQMAGAHGPDTEQGGKDAAGDTPWIGYGAHAPTGPTPKPNKPVGRRP